MRLPLLALLLPLPLAAQIRASELASISQTIDGTTISVEYSRPRARGRDSLFGKGDMKKGWVWTPGANYATTLDVSKDVTVNGTAVARGKYSMWFILNSPTEWTLLLDSKAHRFHEDRPDSTKIPLKLTVHPEAAPFTEVLTWAMPEMRMSGGTLTMLWERKRVPLDIEVQPSLVMTLSAADAAPYLGNYTWSDVDSTGKVLKTYKFIVTHEDNTLKGQWDPMDDYFKKFALVRIAPDWFAPGVYDKGGQIYEVLKPDLVVEFTRKDGRAASLVLRDDTDAVVSRATRAP
ncbi:MAG: DUF2911 domain-containing protein [Gemmatimonadaceae bacterium]